MRARSGSTTKHLSFLLLSLFCVAAAQSPKTKSSPGAAPSDAIEPIRLGHSVLPLNGPYKFSVGDSPLDHATHQPLWAKPSFDDTQWETVDLTPPKDSYDPIMAVSGYVPGWTAKGHPGYSGYAWYRIRVSVEGLASGKLALAGSDNVDDAFQVFSNGLLLGGLGDFSTAHPALYYNRPTVFAIPSSAQSNAVDGTQVLAFRVWMDPSSTPGLGGFHTVPLLGDADAVMAYSQVRWLAAIRLCLAWIIEAFLFALLAMMAFSLTLFDRSDKVYYWIAGVYALSAINVVLFAAAYLSQSITYVASEVLDDGLFAPLLFALWVMTWRVWFQLKRPVWLPTAAIVLTLLLMSSNVLGDEMILGLISHPVAAAFHLLSVFIRLAFLTLMVSIVILGVRQQGREGWIVLPAVVMLVLGQFQDVLRLMHVQAVWFPIGVRVSLVTVADLLLFVALFFLLLRRMFLSLRQQREQALDIQQAVEVQRVILPESHTVYPGFIVDTEYRAARQVGGDFFQIIPHPTDGSVLIVAGDVTGKGLQAGMTVALLIGAIRTAAHYDSGPLAMLGVLNDRLIGRKASQATCLALRIATDGSATLANGGHLPPYLNGTPLPMEGALPLGLMEGAQFSVMHFQLAANDKLLMISDGILEATNEKGELFGFERIFNLLQANTTPSALADAAQRFGQDDDISLVALTRTA